MSLRVMTEEIKVHVMEVEVIVVAALTVGKVVVENDSINHGVNDVVTGMCFAISKVVKYSRPLIVNNRSN